MPRMTQLRAREVSPVSVIVEASSPFGEPTTMVLPLTLGKLQQGLDAWDAGAYVQDAFPSLNAGEREFLMTGIVPEKWAKMFPKDDPEEN